MYKAKLSIHETTWSGFAVKVGEPSSHSKDPYTIEVSNKEEITLEFAGRKYTIQVKEITENSIELHTDNLSAKSKDYGIITHPEPYEVMLSLNQTETFLTPTLDAGTKWEIKLLSVEKLNSEENSSSVQKPTEGINKPKVRIPKAYFSETQKIVKQLEEKLSTKIIIYFVPDKYFISQEHPDFFLEQLRDIGHQEKISLILYSFGGSWEASMRIVSILRQYCQTFEVIVPSVCSSAATKLALGADKIFMTSNGFLTPVDTQYDYKMNENNNMSLDYNSVSGNSIYRILDLLSGSESQTKDSTEVYKTILQYIHPTLLGDILRMSKQSELTGTKLMKMHPASFDNNEEKIVSIAKHLVYGYPSHGFPIVYEEAKEIGLPVERIDDDTTYLLWDLIKLYKAVTREFLTHVRLDQYHAEEVPVVIEAIDKRVIKRYSYNKQYFATEKKWQTTNDNSQWAKLTPSDSPTKPFDTTPIEAEEAKEYQVPIEGKEPSQPH